VPCIAIRELSRQTRVLQFARRLSRRVPTREFLAVNFARFYEAAITAVISRDILPLIITLPSKRLETFLSIRSTFPSGCPRIARTCALDCRIALCRVSFDFTVLKFSFDT